MSNDDKWPPGNGIITVGPGTEITGVDNGGTDIDKFERWVQSVSDGAFRVARELRKTPRIAFTYGAADRSQWVQAKRIAKVTTCAALDIYEAVRRVSSERSSRFEFTDDEFIRAHNERASTGLSTGGGDVVRAMVET